MFFDFFYKTLTGEKFSYNIIGAVVSAISQVAGGGIAGHGSMEAAEVAAGARDAATRESGRQFDITQEQLRPFREAGYRGLSAYEDFLNQAPPEVRSELPGAFTSSRNIPAPYEFASGDYENRIQSDPLGEFSYSGFESDPGRLARISGGMDALNRRGVSGHGLEGLSSNLATREYSRARDRAYSDYMTDVDREQDRYGRSTQDYARRTGRENELYGRGRQEYLDLIGRERELNDRAYRDYQSGVGREEEQYRRDLERYGRLYADPLSRYAELAGIGQRTVTGLGNLRDSYSRQISANTAESGRLRGAGVIGQANAYAEGLAGAANALGRYYG